MANFELLDWKGLTTNITSKAEYGGLADTKKNLAIFLQGLTHIDAVGRLDWRILRLGQSFWAWRATYDNELDSFVNLKPSDSYPYYLPTQEALNQFLHQSKSFIGDKIYGL